MRTTTRIRAGVASSKATTDGNLRFEIDGLAERSFDYRRIGICVLHPRGPTSERPTA